MTAFPSKFKILRDSFTESLGDRTISSQMDVGPAKKRRRTILPIERISLTVKINLSDVEDFKTFYYTNDVGVFDIVNPRTKLTLQARFASVPTLVLNETYYTSTFELEIMP